MSGKVGFQVVLCPLSDFFAFAQLIGCRILGCFFFFSHPRLVVPGAFKHMMAPQQLKQPPAPKASKSKCEPQSVIGSFQLEVV